MNQDLLLILPGGLIWLPVMAWALGRLGRTRTASLWLGAWLSIWLSGVLLASSPDSPVMRIVSGMFGTGFSVLIVLMTYRFGNQPIPRGLPIALAALVGVKGLVEWQWMESAWYAVAGIDAPLVTFAAFRLIRRHTLDPELGVAERMIGPMLLMVVGVEFIDFRDGPPSQMTLLFVAWLTAAVTTSFVMLLVIAERRQRQLIEYADTLDAERRVLDGMIEAVPTGILLSDRHGRIERLNQMLCSQLGVSGDSDHWRGRLARETLLACREDLVAADRTALEEDPSLCALDLPVPPRPLEFRFVDGRILSVSAHAVWGEDRSYRGRVWVSRSVGEERRIAEEIHRAERLATVGTLAGGLAHDFNNQLTAIIGSASLLIGDGGLDASARELLNELIGAADHCADLTGELLAFARHEPAEPGRVDLAAVVDRAMALMRPALQPDVEIHVQLAEGVGAVRADESQLQRVLTNLLVNAHEAVGARGSITLTARPVAGRVAIEVQDDGPGMDEETRRRAFDPFFTTKPVGVGTGLGLAVVYGIVDAHGGSIEVESAPGHGTTFRLEWPSDRILPDAEPASGQAPKPTPTPRTATVLFAEDEPAVRKLLARGLEQAGFRVISVADGDAAVAAFEKRAHEIDVLVLDKTMPGRSGPEVVRAVRQLSPLVPALIVSANPSSADEEEWPADIPVLRKPFPPQRLAEEIRGLLGNA